MQVAVLLFDEFETLDVFGPVEIFGRLKDHYTVYFYSQTGGLIGNSHGVSIPTQNLSTVSILEKTYCLNFGRPAGTASPMARIIS